MGLRLHISRHVLETGGGICAGTVIITMLAFALAAAIIPIIRVLL